MKEKKKKDIENKRKGRKRDKVNARENDKRQKNVEKLKKRERIEPGRKRGKKPQGGWAWGAEAG